MNHIFKTLVFAVALGSVALLSSCSNKPTDEEMRQLVALRAEVAQLQTEVEAKQKEKEDLEKQVASKKSKLQSVLDEQKSAQTK
ncbi:MAG: hypothetical protein KGZ58_13470 [Ignavibacteriales bacterium]|nr:hypothetical protein [Ignavibacteriales bacterium]